MKKNLRIIGSLIAVALVAAPIAFLTVSCGGGSDSGGGVAKNARFAAAWTTTNYLDSMYGVIMAADNGEVLFARVDTDGNGEFGRVGHIVYQDPNGKQAVIYLGADGLPMFLVDSDNVFQFLNYTDTTVDVYRMGRDGVDHSFPNQADTTLKNRPAGIAWKIDSESTIELDEGMQALVRAADEEYVDTDAEEREGFSFGKVITAAKFALSAVGCGTAIAAAAPTVVGGLVVAGACGSLLLDMLDELGFDIKPAFLEDVELAMSAAGCLGKDIGDCISLTLEAIELGIKSADEFLEWFNQKTGRAITPGLYTSTGSLRNRGGCEAEGYSTQGGYFIKGFDGGFVCRAGDYYFSCRYAGTWRASGVCRLHNKCWWNEEDEDGTKTKTDIHYRTHYARTGMSFTQNSISADSFSIKTCAKYGCYQDVSIRFSRQSSY